MLKRNARRVKARRMSVPVSAPTEAAEEPKSDETAEERLLRQVPLCERVDLDLDNAAGKPAEAKPSTTVTPAPAPIPETTETTIPFAEGLAAVLAAITKEDIAANLPEVIGENEDEEETPLITIGPNDPARKLFILAAMRKKAALAKMREAQEFKTVVEITGDESEETKQQFMNMRQAANLLQIESTLATKLAWHTVETRLNGAKHDGELSLCSGWTVFSLPCQCENCTMRREMKKRGLIVGRGMNPLEALLGGIPDISVRVVGL